jgi:2-polyprenyl-3-methyl-5-hydroxy-6-metoxy-1,4-benzoquinol methylase
MDYEKGGIQKEYYSESEVISRVCPMCESGDYAGICKERGCIGIVKCKQCGLMYVNPMVKDPEKNYWGDEKKYFEEARLIFEDKAKSHRDINYLEDLKVIEKIKPTGNFLDIGTNAGFFLRHTRGKKWNVIGIDPSPVLSEMARKYFDLNVKTCYLNEAGFKDEYFDVVTMTDVFEHLPDPKKMLADIKKVIKKDGILFIKVPNGKCNMLKLWLAKAFGKTKDYDIFDSYEHVTHFTHKTLKRMLVECGFKVTESRIGRPVQIPSWHKYVGRYYQYPSPYFMDWKNYTMRGLFYWISKIERIVRFGNIGCFAPNIIIAAVKKEV